MNNKKKPFFERAEAFFAGKGFYIVLFLCVTVIGVSAWSLLTGGEKAARDSEIGVAAANIDPGEAVTEDAAPAARTTPKPAATPAPTSAPTPVPTRDGHPASCTTI